MTLNFYLTFPEKGDRRNAIYRALIAVIILGLFGLVEEKMAPWNVGISILLPLIISYILIGSSIAVHRADDWKNSALYGLILGLIVYGILHSWLLVLGFYSGGLGAIFIKLFMNITSLIVASVVVLELSKVFKISNDKSK